MSRITVHEEEDGVQVWLDTEVQDRDGLCIGVGATRAEALVDASLELQHRLQSIRQQIKRLKEAQP